MRSQLIAAPLGLTVVCAVAFSARPLVCGVSAQIATATPGAAQPTRRPVAGVSTSMLATAITHSKQSTPSGRIETSTETVDLSGDLKGRILYQVTSVFDFAKGTLVNRGRQVFSGTVLESVPVMLYDDAFRFEVDLKTGKEAGEVHLTRSLAGPNVRCDLKMVGSGKKDANGNPTGDYTGECVFDER